MGEDRRITVVRHRRKARARPPREACRRLHRQAGLCAVACAKKAGLAVRTRHYTRNQRPCHARPFAQAAPGPAIGKAESVRIVGQNGGTVERSRSRCRRIQMTDQVETHESNTDSTTTPLCGCAGGCSSSTKPGDARAGLIHFRTSITGRADFRHPAFRLASPRDTRRGSFFGRVLRQMVLDQPGLLEA